MKKTIIAILFVSIFFACSQDSKPSFDIDLPVDYKIEKSNDEYNILTATKYSGEEVSAMIEIRYSDDWSFATFTNDEYISEMIKSDKFKASSSILFDNFKIHSKQKFYLKNIGNCFYASYSGDNYENGVRITNLVLQFVKNNKLFTLIGSSFPEDFSSNQKQFLKIFDTFKL